MTRTLLFLSLALFSWQTRAADWHVDGSAAAGGTGSASDPFDTIASGIDAAMPGDIVVVSAGTYTETATTVRSGTESSPITIEGDGAVIVENSGRVLVIDHSWITVRSIVFDGLWGDRVPVTVNGTNSHVRLEDCEVRNTARDCVDLDSASDVTIDGCRIHHCLRWEGERVDAHGVTCGGVVRLTIRDSQIYQFSGDAIQLSPSRDFWDELLVQSTTMWIGPLGPTGSGFPEGSVPGENAFDAKTPDSGPRSRAVFRDVTAHGFSGAISNQGVFNVKENCEVIIDGVTIYDSEIAFRLRHPSLVTVMNAVVFDCDYGVRYEDGITDLLLLNSTFGDGIGTFLRDASSDVAPTVQNCLFLSDTLPSEADSTNMLANATFFDDAAGDDYHLLETSPPVDAGITLTDVTTDRDWISRPQGSAYDVGAYEWTDTPPPDDPPDASFPDTSADPAPDASADAPVDTASDDGTQDGAEASGCGCTLVR
ncbi:MAG: right-handed parallel beta-helix repeat-containing protein [Deltaproteobacteria bacterium]|nr:right-handed parallel beta-helix repeat-containing protein [Deltaproteobacteria bacterium]